MATTRDCPSCGRIELEDDESCPNCGWNGEECIEEHCNPIDPRVTVLRLQDTVRDWKQLAEDRAQQIADLKVELVDMRAAYAELSKVNAELRQQLDAQIALNVEHIGDKRALQNTLQRGMGVLAGARDRQDRFAAEEAQRMTDAIVKEIGE